MQLSLLALVVIPELRISDKGLVDVTKFDFVPVLQSLPGGSDPTFPVGSHPNRFGDVRTKPQRKRDVMANFPFQRLQTDISLLIARTTAGDRLPSEPDLAKSLGVSRATLREAMRMFEAQGLIRRRQGSGTFVVGQMPVIEAGLELLESLETMAERLGLEVTVSDLHVECCPADEITRKGWGWRSGRG